MDNESKYLNKLDNAKVKEMIRDYFDIIEWKKDAINQYMEYGLLARKNNKVDFLFQTGYDEESITLTDFNATATYGCFDSEELLKLAHVTNMYMQFGVEYLADFEAHERAPHLEKLAEVSQFVSKVKNNTHAKENEEPLFERINPLEDYPTDCLPFD